MTAMKSARLVAMKCLKMHGCGNGILLVDRAWLPVDAERLPTLARLVCDRRKSLGGDTLVVFDPSSPTGEVSVEFWNADGSEGELCINGLRCLAATLVHLHPARFLRGEWNTAVCESVGEVGVRATDLEWGEATFRPQTLDIHPLGLTHSLLRPGDRTTFVDLGNPHLIVELAPGTDDRSGHPLNLAKALHDHEGLPKPCNVHIVRRSFGDGVDALPWERGVGPTQSCGSGAAAIAAVLAQRAELPGPAVVRMPGGELTVHFERPAGTFTVSGRVAFVSIGHAAIRVTDTLDLRPQRAEAE
ncbi:MAG: diaminopimelate epimerase [Planctomycetota bacterium]